MNARAACVILLCSLPGSTLVAQRPQTRHGFWISFGWGYGSAAYSCDSCTATGRSGALTGYLRMGGTVSPRVLLGGESNGWLRPDSAGGQTFRGNASFSVYYYPAPERGHFLKAGVGMASFANNQPPEFAGIGLGFILGAGTDLRVGRNFSLTPAINWFAGAPQPTAVGFTGPSGYFQNVFQVLLGFTFH